MTAIRPGEPLLLTPNERQVMSHWEAHDRAMMEAGETVWETLAACSWTTFLRTLWEERLLQHRGPRRLPSLMNPWQERFLWIKVLEQSPQGDVLLNMPAAGRLAAEAWEIVCSFELSQELWNPPVPHEEETVAFLGWAEAFVAACERERWLDSARLEATLAKALEGGEIPPEALPSSLKLVGFAALTPSQRRLLDGYRRLGLAVQIEETAQDERDQAGEWCRTVAKDAEGELRAAAMWIRRLLEEAPKGQMPRLALVVPDLTAARASVTRILDEVLQPGFLLPHKEGEESLYNLSLGLPLASWPVVADALSLLELDGSWQPLPSLGVLFHSPFLAGAEVERDARALLEARFLRDGAFKVSLSRVVYRAQRVDLQGQAYATTCPLLAQRLEGVVARIGVTEKRLPPSGWAEEFKALLDLYGWPGERVLDSAEYQTMARWIDLLAQLGSLDKVHPQMRRAEAVLALRRMAEETVYQPKVARGPVEVLGYLEAAGLPFDHLWMVGMHDAAWPQASRPNPYLPTALQRQHSVPHSSADRELEFATRLTDQLLRGAPRGVVSCAAQEGDQSLRPSLLVQHLPQRSLEDLPLSPVETLPAVLFQSRMLERVLDPGPPVVAEGAKSMGGTSIFKLQAACAFRAFASLRLHARPLYGVDAGLDAAQRGNLLHHVLEGFWKRARTSRALHDWPEELRDEALEEAVEDALLKGKKERPDVLTGTYLELERQRLHSLARDWLELESQRGYFVVRDTEKPVELQFGDIRLRTIVDRIDIMSDGSVAVVDYKTGMVNYRDWLGERPADPQLPLYCVASLEPVSLLAFARLRAGEMAFSGIGEKPDVLPGVHASEVAGDLGMTWEERQAGWRSVLEELARQFHRGEFRVDPLQRQKTCRSCRLETLCRIDEIEAQR